MDHVLRIGTRASALATWQAQWVAQRLESAGRKSQLVTISTRGDENTEKSIETLGADGVFVKELQKPLLDGRIDIAVHSLKDLPTEPVKGLILAAVPERESPRDVLLSRDGVRFGQLPNGARVATGSLRRRSQLLHLRPDLRMVDVRGNVDTRLAKLRDGQFDALILAEAGLNRLGLADQITEVFSALAMLPAIGQGALAIETCAGDPVARETASVLDDNASHQSVLAERTLLATLRGGCLAPIGAWGRVEDDGRLHLSACVLNHNGSNAPLRRANWQRRRCRANWPASCRTIAGRRSGCPRRRSTGKVRKSYRESNAWQRQETRRLLAPVGLRLHR